MAKWHKNKNLPLNVRMLAEARGKKPKKIKAILIYGFVLAVLLIELYRSQLISLNF